MTELFRHATDDQIALAFCFAGVFVSGMIMHFSFHVGQFAQKSRMKETLRVANADESSAPMRRRDAA